MKSPILTFRLPQDLREKFSDKCQSEKVEVSEKIRQLIEAYCLEEGNTDVLHQPTIPNSEIMGLLTECNTNVLQVLEVVRKSGQKKGNTDVIHKKPKGEKVKPTQELTDIQKSMIKAVQDEHSQGTTLKTIRDRLGITKTTYDNWMRHNQIFNESIQNAKGVTT